jgi:hypothetical protein
MASPAVQSLPHPPHLQAEAAQAISSSKQQPHLHDVSTTLNYYKDPGDGSSPPPHYVGKPETYDRPMEPLAVTIHDIRGSEAGYTLDRNGFQLYNFESKEKDFLDDDTIKAVYYPETEQLLKEVYVYYTMHACLLPRLTHSLISFIRRTGASKIFIFDHTIRRQHKDSRTDAANKTLRGPVQRVHIDQSYQATLNRVAYLLPDEAAHLLKGRVQIINVWRPIKPIYKDPLAVADAHSVLDSDLVGVPLIYPDRVGELYTVKPSAAHKWYYAYGQRPDEVMLIKCFDSKTDGRAQRVPHSAFVSAETEHREARESIEVRALVFHPEDRE